MEIRERITRKLLSHDPNLTEDNVIAFKEGEYKIIRLIARGSAGHFEPGFPL
jgi:hypothetical protein